MHPNLSFRTIVQAGTGRHGIDARELHSQLDNGTRFATWIERRIEEYDLADGRDFFSVLGKTSSKGGRPRKDYILTLTTAKELAMVERTDQGRTIRRYLIDLEARVASGDVTLAAEIADRASDTDQEWLATRMQGKVARNRFTATLKAHGVEARGYGDCTNEIYKPIIGAKADEIRQLRGLKPRANVRDTLPLKQLFAVGLAEILAAERIEANEARGNTRCRIECSRAALNVAGSLLAA
ncbi:MAG TPA: antA/AntB antirepressor family protein [Azoarcus taiwanensis]|nr:antA/AntB antirepressor family protein [Azoarcus taiwanensis]